VVGSVQRKTAMEKHGEVGRREKNAMVRGKE